MNTEKKLLNRMQAYCARAERCRFDVETKLKQAGADAALCERILQQLVEERFLDDERFAHAYARDKYCFNGWGPRRIALELGRRRIPAAVVTAALSALQEGDDKPEDTLPQLMERKLRTVKAADDRTRMQRLVRWAVGRGFEYDRVMKEASRLIQNADAEEW
ncbi:regulatory protein RecX [Porphyromonas loveana]|uniref:regulatory protein RecX n=2 Tax=Porphyromonas loveana TaxID=1884669 RepID=UPI0035A1105A